MSSALPHQPSVEYAPKKQTDVVVGEENHSNILQVLSSDTAQEILTTLKREPGTASDIATAIGQSIQNVTYHLDRLRDVDLVAPVGTWYSEKGKEMTVYAVTTEELVVRFSESAHQTSDHSSGRG
ncbi:ArsR/SmtB family transcription factor [Halobellus limi]|uniref:Helix-turn-helix domain-containing protein n=1 Tax=Halobellus limi TaxID=699433 RepID=A0A1H6BSP6_9EURY|nr:winged helix-turn-helix domain-containing protein [Halobellus limi]SEG63734.1 Helix-turn-helix domain-containing protein [Halobellus limi]